MTINQPYITFHDDHRAPQLGMGTWQLTGDAVVPAIQAAAEAGYRSIDTAAIYGNEAEVGRGIAQCGIPREDLFVTTKVWNDRHGHDSTKTAFQESLDRLGLDYVDLYLIHWPVPQNKRYLDTWEALIQLRDEGRARSIGVCNFQVGHLQKLLDSTGVLPVVNQIELHPHFQQAELRAYHQDHDIRTDEHLGEALPGHGVDAGVRGCGDRLMPVSGELRHHLRADQSRAANHNDLRHVLAFRHSRRRDRRPPSADRQATGFVTAHAVFQCLSLSGLTTAHMPET